MLCASCGQQRNKIHSRESNLAPGMRFPMCNDCIDKKYEPRYIIILVGRAEGPDRVKTYITNRRYCGKEILARELIAK